MEIAGNKRASEYYGKNNMFKDGVPNHEHPALGKYKQGLQIEALKEIGEEPAPVAKQIVEKVEAPSLANLNFEEEKQPDHVEVKVASADVYTFSNVKTQGEVQLNAKKLDIDFDAGDDFFDSFGAPEPVQEHKPTGLIETENDSNPFKAAEPERPKKEFTLGKEDDDSDRQAFVQKRLKELAGKKAISSDDFERIDEEYNHQQLGKFEGKDAISSDAFF